MILVALEGAVVRITGSGAGCGDHWPLCNGQILPHHPRLATVIEFTHRSMTGLCTGLTAALIGWTFLAQPAGSKVRRAAVASGIFLLLEALLGAVLVLGKFVERNTSNMRVLVQGVHVCNTLLLLGALSLAWWWQRPRPAAGAGQPGALSAAVASLLALLVTGATGSVAALADTIFPAADLRSALLADFAASSPLLVRMRWMHPAASCFAALAIVLLAMKMPRRRWVLFGLLGLQWMLGVADVFALAPAALQVLHLLAADLLWLAVVITGSEVVFGDTRHADRRSRERLSRSAAQAA